MGYNTTILIMNDAVQYLDQDPDFGKNLKQAILEVSARGKSVDVPIGNHSNGCQVIETHHANQTAVITVGGNRGKVVKMMHGGNVSTEGLFA